MEFKLKTKVTKAAVKGKKAVLTLEPAAGGDAETLEADVVLVSIGRRPHTDGLALDKAGLELNKRGQIETDHDFRTAVDGIWAIGDVVPGPMLEIGRAHVCTPVTNAKLVCRLLFDKKNTNIDT